MTKDLKIVSLVCCCSILVLIQFVILQELVHIVPPEDTEDNVKLGDLGKSLSVHNLKFSKCNSEKYWEKLANILGQLPK